MKISITITIDVDGTASVELNGKPYSLIVPDEKEPPVMTESESLSEIPKGGFSPVLIHNGNRDASAGFKWDEYPESTKPMSMDQATKEHEAAMKEESKPKNEPHPKPEPKKGDKRGPYKKKAGLFDTPIINRKPDGVDPTHPRYASCTEAFRPRPMLGCQATTGKFIVNNTYFPGRIDEAREKYLAYLEKMKQEYKEAKNGSKPGILTWGSWLVLKYPKTLQKTTE